MQVTIICFLNGYFTYAQTQPLKLWYNKPASRWEETLPLGNGRLGMMPDGGIIKENIVLKKRIEVLITYNVDSVRENKGNEGVEPGG